MHASIIRANHLKINPYMHATKPYNQKATKTMATWAPTTINQVLYSPYQNTNYQQHKNYEQQQGLLVLISEYKKACGK